MIDWMRDEDGKPKTVKTGAFMLVKDGNIYFGIKPEDLKTMQELMREAQYILDEQ